MNDILDVYEPSMCEYHMKFSTPAAIVEAREFEILFSLFQKVQFSLGSRRKRVKLTYFYGSTSYVLLPYIPFFYTK